MKSVQIPERLFLELCKYHLGEVSADERYIRNELERKLNSLANRQRYGQAMAASSNKERQELLESYYKNKR